MADSAPSLLWSALSQLLAAHRRRLEEEEEDEDVEYSWSSPNVSKAIAVSIGAGLATGLGGLTVMAPQVLSSVSKAKVLAVALAISAGVMLYVSFIEIFAKAQESILESYHKDFNKREGIAAAITTACFFAGMAICALLELIVHAIHHHFSPALSTHEIQLTATGPIQSIPTDEIATSVAELGQVRIEPHAEPKPSETGSEAPSVTASSAPLDPAERNRKSKKDDEKIIVQQDIDADFFSGVPGECDEKERARLSRMGAMTAVAIALHNLPEGLATFLATVADPEVGIALGVAIAIHNIPEGVCVAMPIYYSTGSKWRGFLWSFLSGLTEPIGGIVGYAILQPVFTDLVFGIIFAMVGGMMVFIVLHELIPTAHRYLPNQGGLVSFFVIVGMVLMALSLVLFQIA